MVAIQAFLVCIFADSRLFAGLREEPYGRRTIFTNRILLRGRNSSAFKAAIIISLLPILLSFDALRKMYFC